MIAKCEVYYSSERPKHKAYRITIARNDGTEVAEYWDFWDVEKEAREFARACAAYIIECGSKNRKDIYSLKLQPGIDLQRFADAVKRYAEDGICG